MVSININRNKLMDEIKKLFPKMRNYENVADVMLAGYELNAIDEVHKQTRYAFIRKGAKDTSFDASYRKYNLLEKKEKEHKVYFVYKRPHAPRLESNADILQALKLERQRLYSHMLANPQVRDAIVKSLSLSTSNLETIRRTLEKGNLFVQLNTYKKVFNFLVSERLYEKRYDYYIIGFRNIPHHYWLSKFALKLLSNVMMNGSNSGSAIV